MENHPFSKPKIKLAIIASILSSLSFAIMLAISKISLATCSINQISFFKSFFSIIPTVILVLVFKKNKSFFSFLKTKQINVHAVRSLSGLAAIYLFLLALRTISLAEANLLFNTTPLFVPLFAYLWKRTPINHKIWPGLFIAFLGMIFLLHPQNTAPNPGIWIALLAGAIGAITILAVRFAHGTEPVCRSLFYYGFFSLFFSGAFYALEGFSLAPLFEASTALPLLGIGVSGFCCQVFFTLSVKYAPAKLIAPFSYVAVIFGLGLDLVFWQVNILLSEIFGMVLVLIGLYFVASLFHRKNPQLLKNSNLVE